MKKSLIDRLKELTPLFSLPEKKKGPLYRVFIDAPVGRGPVYASYAWDPLWPERFRTEGSKYRLSSPLMYKLLNDDLKDHFHFTEWEAGLAIKALREWIGENSESNLRYAIIDKEPATAPLREWEERKKESETGKIVSISEWRKKCTQEKS